MKYKWLILIVLFFGCGGAENDTNFEVKGTITNAENKLLYFQRLTATATLIQDSVILDDKGNFSFGDRVSEKSFYRLKLSNDNFLTVIVDSADIIAITADASNLLKTAQVSGSDETNQLFNVNRVVLKYQAQIDTINQMYTEAYGQQNWSEVKRDLENQFMEVKGKLTGYLKLFIDNSLGSLVTLFAINHLSPETDSDYFLKVDDALMDELSGSPYVAEFHKRTAALRKTSHLSIGSPAPELIFNDPEGKSVALSSLQGKIVLIDFWASWCGPCRKENPNVVRVYNLYRDKGFEIYGVSLDNNRTKWVNAIKRDKIEWVQVSDLKARKSEGAQMYNITSIPFTYLLDREGKIIAKGLRGRTLESRLEKIFSDEAASAAS